MKKVGLGRIPETSKVWYTGGVEKPDPAQIEIYRKMTPSEKIALAEKLYWDARALREAALRSFHPELSDQEIKVRVKREFLLARTD